MVFGFDYSLVNLLSLVVGLAFLANGFIIVRSERESLELFVMSLLLGTGSSSLLSSPTCSRSWRGYWAWSGKPAPSSSSRT